MLCEKKKKCREEGDCDGDCRRKARDRSGEPGAKQANNKKSHQFPALFPGATPVYALLLLIQPSNQDQGTCCVNPKWQSVQIAGDRRPKQKIIIMALW